MNIAVNGCLVLMVLLWAGLAPVHAQEPRQEQAQGTVQSTVQDEAGGPDWSVSFGVLHRHDDSSQVSTHLGPSRESRWTLRRHASWGVMGLEHLQAHRPGRNDQAVGIDAYPRLWSGAYGNFALQHATSSAGKVWPSRAWRAEIFQGLAGGWELSAGWDRLSFDRRVQIGSWGVGRYFGNHYWRARVQRTKTSDGSEGWGGRMMARHYYRGDADSFVELNASYATLGRFEDMSTATDQVGRSHALGWSWQHQWHPAWAIKTQMSWWKNHSPSPLARSRELGLTVTTRW